MFVRLYVRFLDILTRGRYTQLLKQDIVARPLIEYLRVVMRHEPDRTTLLAYRKVLACWDDLDKWQI